VVTRSGLTGWTIEAVASEARCAKGLVNYHFGSKAALQEQTRLAIEQRRASDRLAAVRDRFGADAIDALWRVLVADADSGRFRAWLGLVATRPRGAAPSPPAHGATRDLISELARALGTPATALPSETVLLAALDGLTLQLHLGSSPTVVEEAYHELWLGLLAD
jgi:AcrR family transcriptional regulator